MSRISRPFVIPGRGTPPAWPASNRALRATSWTPGLSAMKRRLVFKRPSLTQARSLFATACLALAVAPVVWTQTAGQEAPPAAPSLGAIGDEVRALFEKSRNAVVRVT